MHAVAERGFRVRARSNLLSAEPAFCDRYDLIRTHAVTNSYICLYESARFWIRVTAPGRQMACCAKSRAAIGIVHVAPDHVCIILHERQCPSHSATASYKIRQVHCVHQTTACKTCHSLSTLTSRLLQHHFEPFCSCSFYVTSWFEMLRCLSVDLC